MRAKNTGVDSALEARAYRRVTLRLVPFLFLCYVVAYLDRVNVGFAKLQMLHDLRMSDTAYGIGAGIFFIGYFLFEVPSNLILHRVGARVWIARIMVTWGVISILMMIVTGTTTFYLLRFLLGIAEAGFFPGIVLYLTHWYPSSRRAQILSLFLISGVIGGPLSGWILARMSGVSGLAGWQWLFLLEGISSLVMGVATYLYLPDSIERAAWLPDDERRRLMQNLCAEAGGVEHASVFATLRDPRVILYAGISFCFVMGLYGITFWLPQLIKTMGVQDPVRIGVLSGIPSAAAGIAAINSIGNLAGFLSPYLIGVVKDAAGEATFGLYVMAVFMLLGTVLVIIATREATTA